MGLGRRNQRVQRLKQLARSRSARLADRAFLIEGSKAVGAALDSGCEIEAVYWKPLGVTPGVVEAAEAAGVPVYQLGSGVMEKVSDAATPQAVMGVASFVDVELAALPPVDLAVVCVDVRDPGNLGTVIRSAEAADADAVICCDSTVDPYNPKAVRASAGSLLRVPMVVGVTSTEALRWLGARDVKRLAAIPRDGRHYTEADLTVPIGIVLGNESAGLPSELSPLVDDSLTIAMQGRSDSLNVGMAATVLCFEALRQRRANSGAPTHAAPYAGPVTRAPSKAVAPEDPGGSP